MLNVHSAVTFVIQLLCWSYVTVHHKTPVKSVPGQFYFIADSDRTYLQLWIDKCSYDTQKWSYESSKHDMSEYVKPRKHALKFSFYTHFQYNYI